MPLSSGIPILSCVSADLGSVGVREVGISFPLFSALLADWLLKHTLHFTPPFARRVATALIPVPLREGNGVVGLKYWQIPVLILKLLKNNGTYATTFTVAILHKARNIYYCCFSWNSQLTFIGLTSMCPLTTPTKFRSFLCDPISTHINSQK